MALTPREIVDRAIELYKPVAIFAGISGGNDSRACSKWMMDNVPGCSLFHLNTGIGIERTREYVRNTCKQMGWPLTEIRANEDCGQDYDEIVKKHGFPGPNSHRFMYVCLKERAIMELRRRSQKKRGDRILIASGARHDESLRRMQYATKEINKQGSIIWVNPIYWWSTQERDEFNAANGVPVNPVSQELGMSGECGCGAFAQPGELERWRKVDPSFGERIDRLSAEVLERGFTWSWDGRPPAGGYNPDQQSLFMPFCAGCVKSAIVKEEMAA